MEKKDKGKGQRNQRRKNETGSFGCSDEVKNLPFLAKLHAILSHRDIARIVSWMPHGRAWRIHKMPDFEKDILPSFFHNCQISSFMRQLNGWGFRRMSEGPDWNAFHHDNFLRGDLQSCRLMARRKKTSTSAATRSPHTSDPNFYAMPFMPELTQTFCLRQEEETSSTHQTEPCNNQEHESAAVATLLAVEEEGADSHDICTSRSGSSSNKKRPTLKSYEKKASKKQHTETDECVPLTTTSSVDIQGPTTNGQECYNIHTARNPTLAFVPQWSATPWNINPPTTPCATTALPLQALPNVGIPSAAGRIGCTQEDIITRCYAYMEAQARFTSASLMQPAARMDQPHIYHRIATPLESQYQMTTTNFDMQPNSFPMAVPSSSVATVPTVEQNQQGIYIPRTNLFQNSMFPRQW